MNIQFRPGPAVLVLALGLLPVGLSSTSHAATTRASTTSALLGELKHATPNEVIRLAPGVYSHVSIANFAGAVTITSEDPKHPAVLKDLSILRSRGLTLSDLDLSAVDTPVTTQAPEFTVPFVLTEVEDVTLRRLNVHGSPDGSLATAVTGMRVRDSRRVTLVDSEFSYLHHGFEHLKVDNLIVRGNRFHNLWDDSIRGGGSSFVLVEDNEFYSNHPDASDPDHPDCIQFWTANTTTPAHDITIRNNHYHRGTGRPVQGVFVKDDHNTLPYLNLVVTGNVIEGGLWNGIAVDGALNAVIEDNRVCGYPDQLSWIMNRDSKGTIIRRNHAQKFAEMNSSGSVSSHNTVISACSAPRPG